MLRKSKPQGQYIFHGAEAVGKSFCRKTLTYCVCSFIQRIKHRCINVSPARKNMIRVSFVQLVNKVIKIVLFSLRAKRTSDWLSVMDEAGISSSPLQNIKDAYDKMVDLNVVQELDHITSGPIKVPGEYRQLLKCRFLSSYQKYKNIITKNLALMPGQRF